MEKISAVYKITNTVTGDFYIGSSRNVKKRWVEHKCPSVWEKRPNSLLYRAFQEYGLEKFSFQIVCSIMPECLKQVEQDCIQLMQPTYNDRRSNGWDIERHRRTRRKYNRKYLNQLCFYKGETLTLSALSNRFYKAGIKHPTSEAKKYLKKDD